jgi:hypothetical protein
MPEPPVAYRVWEACVCALCALGIALMLTLEGCL